MTKVNALRRKETRIARNNKAKALRELYASKLRNGFPTKLLKVPKCVGKTNTDYGGHSLALNFPENEVTYSYGRLSVGLMYESDHKKVTHPGCTTCRISRTVLKDHLKLVLDSLKYACLKSRDKTSIHASVWETMRVEFQCGNQTLQHNDACYGTTPNFVMFHDQQPHGGGLRVRLFPPLRCSVVRYNDQLFIPMQASEARDTLKMYGLDRKTNKALKFLFPFDVINDLLPHGNLEQELIVIGIKEDKIQYVKSSQHDIVPTPKTLPLMDIQSAFDIASRPQNLTIFPANKAQKMHRLINQPHVWHKFCAWKYVHHYDGERSIKRTHAYFCQIRYVPTSSNYRHGTFNDFTAGKLDPVLDLTSNCSSFLMPCSGCVKCVKRDLPPALFSVLCMDCAIQCAT